jgi:hypothetical protein
LRSPYSSAFVATNSICQGLQASVLWPLIFANEQEIAFAHTSFKWANLASPNAGVSVIIVGLAPQPAKSRRLFETNAAGAVSIREIEQINAYLLNARNVFVFGAKVRLAFDSQITDGSGPLDGGNLILSREDFDRFRSASSGKFAHLVKPYLGSSEFIRGTPRWCLWVTDENLPLALENPEIATRIKAVEDFRKGAATRAMTAIGRYHKFAWINKQRGPQIIIPTVFSEKREFITAGWLDDQHVISNAASIVQEPNQYVFSIISSSLHLSWVWAVAGRLKTDIRYKSALCYNTFPVSLLTEQNKADLTAGAENILLAREAHFPASIADLYDPTTDEGGMPDNLRAAHERNDELLERIYIGRSTVRLPALGGE